RSASRLPKRTPRMSWPLQSLPPVIGRAGVTLLRDPSRSWGAIDPILVAASKVQILNPALTPSFWPNTPMSANRGLRCDQCGQLLRPVDTTGEDLTTLVSLTQEQATHLWPHLVADLGLHEYACPSQPDPTQDECGSRRRAERHGVKFLTRGKRQRPAGCVATSGPGASPYFRGILPEDARQGSWRGSHYTRKLMQWQ